MELPDDDSDEEKVFAANATGKCSLRVGEEVGDMGSWTSRSRNTSLMVGHHAT